MIEDFEEFLSNVTFDQLTEPDSKSAYIWILGEFGSEIDLAPYIIERMIKTNLLATNNNVQVNMSILLALVKLFFSRAPEVKEMLGEFFKYVLTESLDVDLKDKASFYYKLLSQDPVKAREIIIG